MSVMCCVYILFLNLVALTYTTQIKSLQDIPAFRNSKTCIKNDQEVLDKINLIIQDGREHLQIVTDFDQTMTRDPGEGGKIVLNSYEMLRLLPSIPQTYREEDSKLFYKYKPYDDDPYLSIDEKSKYMDEWYRESQNLLRGFKFPKEELDDLASNVTSSFRDGVNLLMEWSEANEVPVSVLSSGFGNAVEATLKAANFLTKNVKVISNFLKLDNDDIIIGTMGEPIHNYNKNEAIIKNTAYYNTVKDRNNVILLGDSVGDANMTDGLAICNNVLKIGFLSKKKHNDLQNYLNIYDIVLENDQTMDVVNAILKLF